MNIIQIKPVDDEMKLRAEAVRILNEFKKLGFTKREAFIEVVFDHDPNYKSNFKRMRLLENFWSGRIKSKFLNDDLEVVLSKLKSE